MLLFFQGRWCKRIKKSGILKFLKDPVDIFLDFYFDIEIVDRCNRKYYNKG